MKIRVNEVRIEYCHPSSDHKAIARVTATKGDAVLEFIVGYDTEDSISSFDGFEDIVERSIIPGTLGSRPGFKVQSIVPLTAAQFEELLGKRQAEDAYRQMEERSYFYAVVSKGALANQFRAVQIEDELDEAHVDEASMMIRNGKPTKLFSVVDTVARSGNKARATDLFSLFVQPMSFYSLFKATPGLEKHQEGSRPVYSVTDDLYQQYVAACKQLGRTPLPLAGSKPAAKLAAAAPTPAPAKSTAKVMPLEMSLCARHFPDAEDYDGEPEFSWIKPQEASKVLQYFDPDGLDAEDAYSDGKLSLAMLKKYYDRMVAEYEKTGKPKRMVVGGSYDDVPKAYVPDLETLYTVWPREGARGARYQKEADLLLCVGPNREVFKR